MTVRRGFLYFGVFLVAAGGVALLGAAGMLDEQVVRNALSLWPLAVIAIGVGLMLRRTRAAVPGGVVAAAAPGLLLGAMFVAVPDVSTPCTDIGSHGTAVTTRDGSFGPVASVDLTLSCGELRVTTGQGTGWHLTAQHEAGREANVAASGDRLSIRSDTGPSVGWTRGAEDWQVTLPTATTLDLDAEVNAGRGRLDLAGARLDDLGLDVNAGSLNVDLGSATLTRLVMDVNAGAASVRLPATGNLSGDLTVNAGSIELCAPADLGLRVRGDATLGSINANGLIRRDSAWETPGYATATYRADLSASASVGSVNINPEGGCK